MTPYYSRLIMAVLIDLEYTQYGPDVRVNRGQIRASTTRRGEQSERGMRKAQKEKG